MAKRNVAVGLMYRPRTLRPDEADIQYLAGPDGKIRSSHNHPDLRHDDAVQWASNWGTRLLSRFPSVDTVILYNLFGEEQAINSFLRHCRTEWGRGREWLSIGHVGGTRSIADVVDIWYPFVPVNGDHGESMAALRSVRTNGRQIPSRCAVIPFLKTDGARSTRASTDQ